MKDPAPSAQTPFRNIAVPAPPFRWGTRVALPLGILIAFGLLFAGSLANALNPSVEVKTVQVVERPAVNRTVSPEESPETSVVVQAAGWLEPDPFPVYATSLTNGSVEEVRFLEGEAVRKGQVLVRLVDDDALLELRRAKAEARAAEEAWEANIEARRGLAVASAAVRETSASLALAQAEREAESALLTEAQRIYERREELVETGVVSHEEYDTAQATARARAARVLIVERRIEELEAKLQRMRAEEAAARKRLELRTEEKRRLELARVALAEADLRVERLEIRSPIDGVVMRRLVEPGSVLMAAPENPQMSRAAELYDPERLQVRVDVPLADAAKVGVGQSAEVTIEVFPGRRFPGTVTRITNFADIQKNTLEVKVALEETAPELKPEMLARVRFLAMTKPKSGVNEPVTGLSVFAPKSALDGGTAWVVTQYDGEEGLAAKRSVVTTGAEEDDWVEIESGLNPGDLLVVSSPARLEPQQRVRIRRGGTD